MVPVQVEASCTDEQEEIDVINGRCPYEPIDSFDDLDPDENILRGIYSFGFEKPSRVQQLAIQPIIDGRDTLISCTAGSGKTAAFVIGALQRIDVSKNVPQVLILAPGRELVSQIHKVVLALGEYMGVHAHACIGGTSVRGDIDKLRQGQHVIVGACGRVYDMISKRHLRVDDVRMLVLDEADEMLAPKSLHQVYDIVKTLHPDVQACAAGTTVSALTREVLYKFMRNIIQILVKKPDMLHMGLTHYYVNVDQESHKLDTLCDLMDDTSSTFKFSQLMVFCITRRKVDWLADQLTKRNFVVSSFHAELDQKERDLVMREFRSGCARVLITTDILARGIDFQQANYIINYDLPGSPETYIHQSGRAGRFGRKGAIVSLLTAGDSANLHAIREQYELKIDELPADFGDMFGSPTQ
jgi:translation initiation factor 4A